MLLTYKTPGHIQHMMRVFLIAFILINLMNNAMCLQDPQTYSVHMSHHQQLTMTQEEDDKQDGEFYLIATNEDYQLLNRIRNLQNKKREKRHESEKKQQTDGSSLYETNDQQYEGSFEAINNDKNQTYDYDYEKLQNEYYNEGSTKNAAITTDEFEYYDEAESSTSAITEKSSHKLKTTEKPDVPTENYCNVVLFFRLRVVYCFWFGVSHNNKDIKERSAWVLAFWLTIYTCTACYLWCTRGWCCCCCPYSVCQPTRAIQEAKRFLAQNPPGVANLGPNDTITYSPNDFEVLCYKDLEKDVFNF